MLTHREKCFLDVDSQSRGKRQLFTHSQTGNVTWILILWLCLLCGIITARCADKETKTISSSDAFDEAKRFSSSKVCAPHFTDTVDAHLKASLEDDDESFYANFAPDFQLHFRGSSNPNKVVILNGAAGFNSFADWWFQDRYEGEPPSPPLWSRTITHSYTDPVSRTWDLDFQWKLDDGSKITVKEVSLFTSGNCIWRTYIHLNSNKLGSLGLPPGRWVYAEDDLFSGPKKFPLRGW